jgi:hypothetical protein
MGLMDISEFIKLLPPTIKHLEVNSLNMWISGLRKSKRISAKFSSLVSLKLSSYCHPDILSSLTKGMTALINLNVRFKGDDHHWDPTKLNERDVTKRIISEGLKQLQVMRLSMYHANSTLDYKTQHSTRLTHEKNFKIHLIENQESISIDEGICIPSTWQIRPSQVRQLEFCNQFVEETQIRSFSERLRFHSCIGFDQRMLMSLIHFN